MRNGLSPFGTCHTADVYSPECSRVTGARDPWVGANTERAGGCRSRFLTGLSSCARKTRSDPLTSLSGQWNWRVWPSPARSSVRLSVTPFAGRS
jgi:hypothetical protein